MINSLNISELLCTRISHDLIGNIGAFANAVELMEDEDDDFLNEIKSTLKTSSWVLASRLKFFRMAFGLANSNLENLETVKKTTADYLKTLNINHPLTLDFKIGNTAFNRIIMLAVMCAADTIIKGGNIEVASNATHLKIAANSPSPLAAIKIAAMNGILKGKMPENLSLYAPFFYMCQLLTNADRKIQLECSETNFSILIS